jgi:hypothetical protein
MMPAVDGVGVEMGSSGQNRIGPSYYSNVLVLEHGARQFVGIANAYRPSSTAGFAFLSLSKMEARASNSLMH